MYTDLATIYERAGRIKGREGSITQLPILTMPDDDMTHPIPDLTGYITEGQISSRATCTIKGIYPPIDVLPCLSRLKNKGIGEGKTREDHGTSRTSCTPPTPRAATCEGWSPSSARTPCPRPTSSTSRFADEFEKHFINQGSENRGIEESLGIAWATLSRLPKSELTRLATDQIDKYYGAKMEQLWGAASQDRP